MSRLVRAIVTVLADLVCVEDCAKITDDVAERVDRTFVQLGFAGVSRCDAKMLVVSEVSDIALELSDIFGDSTSWNSLDAHVSLPVEMFPHRGHRGFARLEWTPSIFADIGIHHVERMTKSFGEDFTIVFVDCTHAYACDGTRSHFGLTSLTCENLVDQAVSDADAVNVASIPKNLLACICFGVGLNDDRRLVRLRP